jgi:hypothetical protein
MVRMGAASAPSCDLACCAADPADSAKQLRDCKATMPFIFARSRCMPLFESQGTRQSGGVTTRLEKPQLMCSTYKTVRMPCMLIRPDL